MHCLTLPLVALAFLPSQDRSPLLLITPTGGVSSSTTSAVVEDRVAAGQVPTFPLALDLACSGRALWVVHELLTGTLVVSRFDRALGTLQTDPDPLPCAKVRDIAAPLQGTRWFLAEPLGPDTRIWRGHVPRPNLAPFLTLVGRPDVTAISIGEEGQLFAFDAGHQELLSIDAESGAVAVVGPTGLAGGSPRNLDLDRASGDLYGVFETPGSTARFGRVDVRTGRVELLAALQGEPAPFVVIDRSTLPTGTALATWSTDSRTTVSGSLRREANDLVLHATGLPAHSFGLFLCATSHVSPATVTPGGLCLAAPLGRLAGAPGQLLATGAEGRMHTALDLDAVPLGGPPEVFGGHGLLHFQAWARAGALGPTFADPVSVPIASYDPGPIDPQRAWRSDRPGTPLSADLDGDGDLDVLVGENGGAWYLWRNDGNGHFTSEQQAPQPYLSNYSALRDVDGDGDLDLVRTDATYGGLRVARNDGDGHIGAPVSFDTCHPVPGIGVGDLDLDGYVDIVYACQVLRRVLVFYGNATGHNWPVIYDLPGLAASLVVYDVDADGELDVLVPMQVGPMVVLRHEQGRTFSLQMAATANSARTWSELVDLLPGGGPELVSWDEPSGTLAIHATDAGLALPLLATVPISPWAKDPELADVDGDGLLDITYQEGRRLLTLRNDGMGGFSAYSETRVDFECFDATLGDYDGDGWTDAFLAAFCDDLILQLPGSGAAWELPYTTLPVPLDAHALAIADLDGDGDDDLLLRGVGRFILLEGLGGATFGPPLSFPTSARRPREPLLADLDGDGDLDLGGLGLGQLVVHENLGSLDFGPARQFPVANPIVMEFGDIDRDGDVDAVVSGILSIQVLKNDGTGSFTQTTSFSTPTNFSALALADMDDDGWLDVVASVVSHGQWLSVGIMFNDAAGGLLPLAASSAAVVDYERLTVYDLDDDGLLDVLVSPFLINLGQRRPLFDFNAGQTTWLETFSLADMDGDGWEDRVSTDSYGPGVRFHRGRGNGQFAPSAEYVVWDRSFVRPILRDVDEDGRPEVWLGPLAGLGSIAVLRR